MRTGFRGHRVLIALSISAAVVLAGHSFEWAGRENPFHVALAHPVVDDSVLGLLAFSVTALAMIVQSNRSEARRRERESAIDRSRAVEEATRNEQEMVRRRFFGAFAHELANTVTPMRLQLAILHRKEMPDLAKPLAVVERSLGRLAVLLRDLLDAARVENKALAIARVPVDLAELAHGSAAAYMPAAEQAGVALRVEADPGTQASLDPVRIEQVLANLLGNALKHTPRGGAVVLRAGRSGDVAELAVSDSGRGLEPGEMAQLFQPFSRVPGQGQDGLTGTGLGLYISKAIVEAHNGRLWCESGGRGKGATFRISLPAAAGTVAAGVGLPP